MKMMTKGMHRNIVFFSLIINNLCKVGRVLDAQNIFDSVSIGLHPNVMVYSTLMDGYCLVRKMERALKVFDALVSAGIEPNKVCQTCCNN
jgi:pentatricopeptide repeat protein